MTVHFIGAGPGAADLITVRGRDLIARCPVCLYAGSIVPRELLAQCPGDARIVDTAPLTLDEIEAEYVKAHAAGLDVARLHSGDIYSALAEQLRRLDATAFRTPSLPVCRFAAAAATLGCGRGAGGRRCCVDPHAGRASAMPRPSSLRASRRPALRSPSILRLHR
jgi:precorrin-4/cobalt-precorrin-4 C11-methyltransferase